MSTNTVFWDVTPCTYILVGPAACQHILEDGTYFHRQCHHNLISQLILMTE